MEQYFAELKDNSGDDVIKPTVTKCPDRYSGYITITIEDNRMSLTFTSEMKDEDNIVALYPKVCTGATEEEFKKSFAAFIENINLH